MIAVIKKNGEEINRIVADEAFAADYCAKNGYTYVMEADTPAPEPEPAYTADDMFKALLGTLTCESGGGVTFLNFSPLFTLLFEEVRA